MTDSCRRTTRTLVFVSAAVLTILAGADRARAQQPGKPAKPQPAPALLLAPLAGQPIAVLPVTFLVTSDPAVAGLPAGHAAQVAWADSIVADGLAARGPEATWTLPDELRRIARRAPGMVVEPDRMGQSVMRYENLRRVPDPLLSNLRSMVAMTSGRYVLIPAALRFTPGAGGVSVEVVLVLVDARNGSILWRSTPVATAATAGAALAATIAWILPDAH
ncbi:MAG: hypothetical protein ACREK8_01575 [Gemmatimonadales bacterium]